MDPLNKTNTRDTLQSEHNVEIHAKDRNQDEIPNGPKDIEGSGNASSPVHLVPTEILATIFHYTLPPETKAQQGARTALASVCRYWNIVVNNSPILWSAICHLDSMESVSTSLARSREASLDVYGSWDRPFIDASGQPGIQDAFWTLISSHRRRWRSVELWFAAPPNHSSVLSPGVTPLLERLSLSMSHRVWLYRLEPLDLFEGTIPRLRHLFLDAVPLRWSNFSAPNLSILHLTNIGYLGPRLSQLHDILTTCPNLTEMNLESISSLVASGSLNPLHPVELHRLRGLLFKYISAGAVQQLLEALRVAAECSVSLQGRVRGHPKDSLFPSHLPDLPTKCLSRASRIVIVVQEDGLWSLNLTLDDMNVIREVLLWLDVTEASPHAEAIPIEMEWSDDVHPKDVFFHLVSGFGNIRRITIYPTFGPCSPCHLGARKLDGSPSFPGLRELRIKEPTDEAVEAINVSIRERQAAHKWNMSVETLQTIIFDGVEGGVGSGAVRPLSINSDIFRSLLHIVNESNIQVWWYEGFGKAANATSVITAPIMKSFESNLMNPQNKTNASNTQQSEHNVEIHAKDKNQDEVPSRPIDIKGSGNASGPVHLIPAELLATILYYALPPETEAQQDARKTLASVCRYWNIVVNSSPTLWSAISHRDPLGSISTSLAKSQEAGLDVYGAWGGLPYNASLKMLAGQVRSQRAFWTLVSSHRRRWRSIGLQFFAPPNHSFGLGPAAAPLLEHLSLSMSSKVWFTREPLDLFEGPIPRLLRLFLDTVPLRWSSLSAPNLSILHLTNIGNLGPHLSQLYDILTTCPNLTEMNLESIPSLAASRPLDPPLPVELRRLRVLVFKSISASAVQWLLEGLRVPAECSVSLHGRVEGHPKDSLFPSHLPDLPTKCLSKASHIVIVVQEGFVRLYSDGLWSLNLTLDDMNVIREVLLWLDVTEVSPHAEAIPIEMEWSDDVHPKDVFFHLVSGFGNIRRITIHPNFGSCSPCDLGARNSDGSPSFPGLRELRIKEPTDEAVEAIIVSIRERQAAHKRSMSVETLRTIILGGEGGVESGAQQPPLINSDIFRSLLYVANESNIQVWWESFEFNLMDPQNKTNARDTLQNEHNVEIHAKDKNQDEIPNGPIDIEGSGNASSPVHVPAEILSTIFHYTLPPETEAQQGARTVLASVCRHWNIVVNNSPILWSAICHRDPIGSISTSLAKSGEARLDVYGVWGILPYDTSPETIAGREGRKRTFWTLVASHRWRWRTLDLQFGALQNHPPILSPGATPLLERLSLSAPCNGWPSREPLDLLEGPIPRLRHLFLDSVPLRWGSFSAPNLSILHLANVGYIGPYFSDILTTCPNLTEITLESITSLTVSEAPDRLHPVELHRLRVLVFKHIGAQWILEGLRLPAECSVSLEDGLWSLNLTLDDMNVIREVLLWLDVTEASPDTETIPIEVEWGNHYYPRDDLFHPVSGFGNVRRITIDPTFGSFSPRPLGARNDGSPSFPSLRELRIKEPTDSVVEAIIVLIRERQAAHKRNMSVETLRAIIFDGLRSGAQQPPIINSETFRRLIHFSNESNIEVWWYGALMTEEGSSD
ncbi:hypothetical protein FRC04_003665 [Tulasnella sp. 424]|nr:hypothetical protein FRC04_003665 [Tulasnella sp. 424]